MSLQAFITRGIPASGKTTWAKNQIIANPVGFIKDINRDDIRFEMFCGGVQDWSLYKFTKQNEAEVTARVDAEILDAATKKQHIICSNTNLNPAHHLALKARLEELGYEVNDVWFHIDFEEALNRNALRPNGVNFQTMARMYRQYCEIIHANDWHKPSKDLPKAVIFDIDGTLAHMNGKRGPFDWHKVGVDDPDVHLFLTLAGYHKAGYRIILLSGRDGVCRPETVKWFEEWCTWFNGSVIPYELHMRPEKDQRKDTVIKYELFKAFIEGKYSVEVVHDDRPVVARMWRHRLGLKVVQHGDPENWF